jgi:hypothetical protein
MPKESQSLHTPRGSNSHKLFASAQPVLLSCSGSACPPCEVPNTWEEVEAEPEAEADDDDDDDDGDDDEEEG